MALIIRQMIPVNSQVKTGCSPPKIEIQIIKKPPPLMGGGKKRPPGLSLNEKMRRQLRTLNRLIYQAQEQIADAKVASRSDSSGNPDNAVSSSNVDSSGNVGSSSNADSIFAGKSFQTSISPHLEVGSSNRLDPGNLLFGPQRADSGILIKQLELEIVLLTNAKINVYSSEFYDLDSELIPENLLVFR